MRDPAEPMPDAEVVGPRVDDASVVEGQGEEVVHDAEQVVPGLGRARDHVREAPTRLVERARPCLGKGGVDGGVCPKRRRRDALLDLGAQDPGVDVQLTSDGLFLGFPEFWKSGAQVLVHPEADRNGTHHGHERCAQERGEGILPIRRKVRRGGVGSGPGEAFLLRHGMVGEVESITGREAVQPEDEGALVRHEVVGHAVSGGMVHDPMERNPVPGDVDLGQEGRLQPGIFLHQDLQAGRGLHFPKKALGRRAQRHRGETVSRGVGSRRER